MIKKYLKLISIITLVIIFFEVIVFGAYMKVAYKPVYDPKIQASYDSDNRVNNNNSDNDNKANNSSDNNNKANSNGDSGNSVNNSIDNEETTSEEKFSEPVKVNFLVVGVDKEEALTDTIMVFNYESTSEKLHILSIPRDTYIELESYKRKKLRNIGVSAPSYMKINSVNLYGGKRYGIEFLKTEIEEMLGIKLDYYIKVNVEAFRKIVDAIGGVEYNVPQRLYYSDPAQDLLIDLYPGLQTLNGEQAEGLVRFRKGYATQDLHRIEVQQDFIKVFVKQIMQKDTIKNNFKDFVITYLNYVETDFSILDIPKYMKFIDTLDSNKIITATLPGYADMIDEISYYIHDKKQTNELVQEFFYGSKPLEEETKIYKQ